MAQAKTNVTGRFGLKSANIHPAASSGAMIQHRLSKLKTYDKK